MTWLEICGKNRDCSGNCPYGDGSGEYEDRLCREDLMADALDLLKEQEYKDRMFHALEDDWKALLKEQEAVVRCKDCKHATMTSDGKMCKYCEMDTDDFGNQRDVYHDADWFCADGERFGNSEQL